MNQRTLESAKPAAKHYQTQAESSPQTSTHPLWQLQAAVGNQAVRQPLSKRPQDWNPNLRNESVAASRVKGAAPVESAIGATLGFRGISQEWSQAESIIQPKLAIGQPNDRYEQEADRVAAEVVERLQPSTVDSQPEPAALLNMQPQTLRLKPVTQAYSQPEAAASSIETAVQQAQSRGQALPETVREPIEQMLGADFKDVKIHADGEADRLNRSLGARAFTSAQHIFFRSGEYCPTQPPGQKLLAHELTHVMQQSEAPHSNIVQCLLTEQEKAEHRKKGFAALVHDVQDGTLTKQEVASLVEDEILSLDIADAANFSWEETKEAIGEKETQQALRNPEFVRAMTPQQQFGVDVDQWMKTMFKSSNSEMTGILKRLFLVLRQGLYFGQGGEDLQGFEMPLAAALSHGGRINMVIDYEGWNHRHQFWNWVMTGKEEKVTHGGKERKAGVTTPGIANTTGVAGLSRRMGTHGVEYNNFGVPLEVSKTDVKGKKALEGLLHENLDDSRKEVVKNALAILKWYEPQGKKTKFTVVDVQLGLGLNRRQVVDALNTLRSREIAEFSASVLKDNTPIKIKQYSTNTLGLGGYKKGKHFGIDLPVGGEGELDVNSKRIEAKGEHGHMYIYYTAPKENEAKFGSLLIGIEGSAPAFFGSNLKGKSDPFGKAHDTKGTSGEFSPTGGQKWRFLKEKPGGLATPAEYDGMIMRITDEIMVAAQTEYGALQALEAKPRLKQKAEEFMRKRLSQGSKVAKNKTNKKTLFDY